MLTDRRRAFGEKLTHIHAGYLGKELNVYSCYDATPAKSKQFPRAAELVNKLNIGVQKFVGRPAVLKPDPADNTE